MAEGTSSSVSSRVMTRGHFLKLAALGVGTLGLPSATWAGLSGEQIMTVRGPIPLRKAGRTLMHEHIMVDFIGADEIGPGRYDPEEVFKAALPRLQEVKAAGCDLLVDCTPAFLGRDPELLRRLSVACGLNIATNTGLYGAANDKYVPRFAYSETAEQLAARWVKEFEEGIAPSGIRPGIIKIGVDSGPLSDIDAKLVVAAAMAHRRTGLTIAAHTGDGTAAWEEITLLRKQQVDPSAFIWVHAQNEQDGSVHRRAAELGTWVEFDGIGPDSIQRHVDLVVAMKRAGHLKRVLISQDAGWYHVGEPGGGKYRGYATLFTEFLPALRKAGLTEHEIDTLMVGNPQRALSLPR
ncbi:MAG: aryldialkylphosphatase [Candidatus Acidiferrum sp.]